MQRLGRNINGYFGETIEVDTLIADSIAAARAHDWTVESMFPHSSTNLLALTRPAQGQAAPAARVYISTGIHGDEPAGPVAIRQLLREDRWPGKFALWVCPCLNPAGFKLNRRENAEGVDLNRQYLQPEAAETKAHIDWLKRQPEFDLCLCLHEDWESHGFYLYELNPERRPSLAEPMIARVAHACPVDPSELIEGRPAQNGIIRPNLDPRSRPQWPESFYLLTHKTRLSYTLEAPSDFPLAVRVAGLVAAVSAALEGLAG